MKNARLKQLVQKTWLRPGSTHRILVGPLRGRTFRTNAVTGMSPFYSGSEREHQHAFRRLVRPGNIVIDVGANWGIHTLYLAGLVGSGGRVLALECFPGAFQELQWHLAANQCANAMTLLGAVSDVDAQALFLPGENPSEGKLIDAADGQAQMQNALVVPARRLDSIVAELALPHVELIKVDVEGAEGRVLAGAQELTARFHPRWIIDLHNPEQDVLVARWLTGRGYTLKRLNGSPIPRPDLGYPHPDGVSGSILAEFDG
jgi:FkbM family methyltransferase